MTSSGSDGLTRKTRIAAVGTRIKSSDLKGLATMRLLGDDELERSAVVATCRMNRERHPLGSNGYDRELGLDPLDFLKQRIATGHLVAWLDLCCGTGRALIQATRQIR